MLNPTTHTCFLVTAPNSRRVGKPGNLARSGMQSGEYPGAGFLLPVLLWAPNHRPHYSGQHSYS